MLWESDYLPIFRFILQRMDCKEARKTFRDLYRFYFCVYRLCYFNLRIIWWFWSEQYRRFLNTLCYLLTPHSGYSTSLLFSLVMQIQRITRKYMRFTVPILLKIRSLTLLVSVAPWLVLSHFVCRLKNVASIINSCCLLLLSLCAISILSSDCGLFYVHRPCIFICFGSLGEANRHKDRSWWYFPYQLNSIGPTMLINQIWCPICLQISLYFFVGSTRYENTFQGTR